MSLKTKIIAVPATAITVLVAAFTYSMLPSSTEPSTSDNYVLSVTWSPPVMPMHSDVNIVVKVEGYPLIRRKVRLSPWGETMAAASGAPIELVATSNHQATQLLDCIIMRNGRSVPNTGHDVRREPGTVRCRA